MDARAFLFGLPTRDHLKGGYIDLLIELATAGRDKLAVSLRTGERKIDVLDVDPQTTDTPVIRAARRDGIAL